MLLLSGGAGFPTGSSAELCCHALHVIGVWVLLFWGVFGVRWYVLDVLSAPPPGWRSAARYLHLVCQLNESVGLVTGDLVVLIDMAAAGSSTDGAGGNGTAAAAPGGSSPPGGAVPEPVAAIAS